MNLAPATKATKKLHYGILIVCEDEKSNFIYIQNKVNDCKPKSSAVQVIFDFFHSKNLNIQGKEIGQQTDKLTIFAIDKVAELNSIFYNAGTEPEENFYREVYCIGDVDDNETNGGKITIANNELIKARVANPLIRYELLLSNECFEIWYILHFQDINEPLYRGTKPQIGLLKTDNSNRIKDVLKNVTNISFKQHKISDKFFEIMKMRGNETEAVKRSKQLALDSQNANPKELYTSNPSTSVYILIEMLNNLN